MNSGNEIVPVVRAGVIGWPARHSLSPLVHGFWLDELGIEGSYERIAVSPEDLGSWIRSLADNGYAGCNVTIPHKEAVMEFIDEIDEDARHIGAVNTIVVREDGSLFGFSSDGFGFYENLKSAIGADEEKIVTSRPAVVLGAGGAARAVVGKLLEEGVAEVLVCNRSHERAEKLAIDLAPYSDGAIAVVPWQHRAGALEGAGLLVNTTSLGMRGKDELELSLDALPSDAVVNDIVYTPLQTALLARARARGNTAVDGLGMLLHQARPGFEAWFGGSPVVSEALRGHVLAGLAEGG